MSEEQNRYPIDKFLDEVKAHRNDRGYLARLKRGLAAGTEEQAWSILAAQGFDFTNVVKRKVWTIIGGLSATLMDDNLLKSEGWDNIGTTLRHAMYADGKPDESRTKSFEARLRRLLNCTSTVELCDLVVGAVKLAQAKGVSVNCRQLYFDLNGWEDTAKREESRVRWARDFYRAEKDSAESESAGEDDK